MHIGQDIGIFPVFILVNTPLFFPDMDVYVRVCGKEGRRISWEVHLGLEVIC